jgi:hypothetical protein
MGELATTSSTRLRPTETAEVLDALLSRARRVLSGEARIEDYLPVTAEVREATDRDLAFARDRVQGQLAPEVEARQLRQRLLSAYYDGQDIAYTEDERGLIVLAVGLAQVSALLNGIPHASRKKMAVTRPGFNAG